MSFVCVCLFRFFFFFLVKLFSIAYFYNCNYHLWWIKLIITHHLCKIYANLPRCQFVLKKWNRYVQRLVDNMCDCFSLNWKKSAECSSCLSVLNFPRHECTTTLAATIKCSTWLKVVYMNLWIKPTHAASTTRIDSELCPSSNWIFLAVNLPALSVIFVCTVDCGHSFLYLQLRDLLELFHYLRRRLEGQCFDQYFLSVCLLAE